MKRSFIVLIISVYFLACDYFAPQKKKSTLVAKVAVDLLSSKPIIDSVVSLPLQTPFVYGDIEQRIIDAGLIDIKKVDSSIVVDLKYSTCDNFLFMDVYGAFNKCYLQPDVAEKLKMAQQFLKAKFPYYSLIVYDAVRPRSIQYTMWDTIAVPLKERSKYVSNPKYGSLHNFGAAVDISIIDKSGYVLDMGTSYDYFGELAYPREEERMIKEGKLSKVQWLNRELLRSVMIQAGFTGITTEWWHFNSCYRQQAYTKYRIVE